MNNNDNIIIYIYLISYTYICTTAYMYTIIFYVWILWISFWFLQAFLFVFFRYCQSLWWAVLSVLVSSSDVGWLSGTFPGVADVWLHLSLAIIQLPKFFDRCEEKSARSLEVDAKLDAKVAASWINWNRAEHGWVHNPHTWVNMLQLRCPASQDRSFRSDIQMLGCLKMELTGCI